jgi:hypothetical protein
LFVLVVSVALVGVDLVVLAQNSNEDARGGAMNSQPGTGARRSSRRTRRRARSDGSGTTTTPATAGVEKTDLSGTYTGTVSFPEVNLNGPATLTITGNTFTITPEGGGSPVSGRLTSVTTSKYTGVTMMFGDSTAPPPTQNPPPPPLPTVSLQAKRTGDRVTLTSVPGEKRQFVFATSGGPGGHD